MITKKEFKFIYITSVSILIITSLILFLGKDIFKTNTFRWYFLIFTQALGSSIIFLLIPLSVFYKTISIKEIWVILPLVLLIPLTILLSNTIYGWGAAKSAGAPLFIYLILLFIASITQDPTKYMWNLILLAITYVTLFSWQENSQVYSSWIQGQPVRIYRGFSAAITLLIPQIVARPFFRKYCLVRKCVAKLKK